MQRQETPAGGGGTPKTVPPYHPPAEKLEEIEREIVLRKRTLKKKKRKSSPDDSRRMSVLRAIARDYRAVENADRGKEVVRATWPWLHDDEVERMAAELTRAYKSR